MAGDYEDLYGENRMTDGELAALVRDQLTEHAGIEPGSVEVTVSGGAVRVAGRIGTEAEYQAVERVITDFIGIRELNNELIVDPLTRASQDEAADVANTRLYGAPRAQRGGANRTEDSAAHLLDDTGAEQYGTGDVGEAVERGYSYNPPLPPFQEGHEGEEDH